MKAPRFEKWFAGLTLLNRPQRMRVQHALHPAAGLEQVIALIDKVRTDARRCPRCDCPRCYRHGHANGWRWALDMGRIATAEQLFNIAIKLIYMKR